MMRIVCAIAALLLVAVASAAMTPREVKCDPSYPDYCIPSPPPDLNCDDIRGPKPFRVRRPDPHHFDRDHDGWACEPPRPKRNH